jgi:vitamin B12 transporter
MNIKQLSLAAAVSALTFTTATNAVLGPIPIYLNTEYRVDTPVIGSIASTLSFDAEDIKATGAGTFLDFLGTVPSVGLFNAQGNVPAIFMRGGHSNHTLFIIDGVKVNGADSINGAIEHGLKNISLNDIEKIEIIKGSGSVLYGSAAIAGVISITTKKGADGKRVTVSTKFGTNNSKTYALSASNGDKDGFVRFTHNKYTTDGINARTIDTDGEKDGISNHSTQIKIGDKNFDISYLETKNTTEYDDTTGGYTWGGIYIPLDVDTNKQHEVESTKITINANKEFSATWNAKLTLARIETNDTLSEDYISTTITILNDIEVDDALVNIGLSKVEDKRLNTGNSLSSNDLFVNWQKNIGSIDINTGARYIKHSKFGNETIYNLGAAKYLDNGIKLTGTYGTAFLAPTLKQINAPESWGGPNLNLKPETSKNIELGLEKSHDWGVSVIKLFKTKSKNQIAYVYSPTAYINNDTYLAKGVELSVNANIAGYDINLDHTYSKTSVNDSDTQPDRHPKNITNLTASKQYGKFNSRAQVIKKSSSIDQGFEFNGYTLINLSTNYAFNDNAKVSFGIKNATDKNYTISSAGADTSGFESKGLYLQPGRTFELGLEYKF